MRILIVEPHPDDTALSAYNIVKHLVRTNPEEVYLVSLFNSVNRDSIAWCAKMGVKYIGISMLPDYTETKKFIPHTKYKNMKDFLKEQLEWYTDIVGNINLAKFQHMLQQHINILKPAVVMSVVGIRHKAHVATRYLLDNILDGYGVQRAYFAEYPYSSRKYAKELLSTLPLPFELFPPGGLKKMDLFWETYPSERRMFLYDAGTTSDCPEVIYFQDSLKPLFTA